MKIETQRKRRGLILDWISVNESKDDPRIAGCIQTIRFFIGLGEKSTETDKNRSAYWSSIKSAGLEYPSFPTFRRNTESNEVLPKVTMEQLNEVLKETKQTFNGII